MLNEDAPTAAAPGAPAAAPIIPGAARRKLATLDDKRAIEATPFEHLCSAASTLELLEASSRRRGEAPAVTFVMKGDPAAPEHTVSYATLWSEIVGFSNALAAAGVQPGETIALLLPNLPETVVALYAAQAVGAVAPLNPLLEPEILAGILDEVDATTIVTMAPLPKTDLAQKAAAAAKASRSVKRIIEIDIRKYLPAVMRPIAALLRPKRGDAGAAQILSYAALMKGAPRDRLRFERQITSDTIGAYYHTGGTTGVPKVARHAQGAMVFNAYITQDIVFQSDDVVLSALPLFHVFSSYVMSLAPLIAGARIILLTPMGFRGPGVMENFWKLIERWGATFMCGVPTAIAALDQRPVNADVSTLRFLVSGSAPLPQALFKKFEKSTGVRILEGYGMTEATCVTACNPPDGERKIGSVGVPMPYVEARIADFDDQGRLLRDLGRDEIGEICFCGPTVFAGYSDPEKTRATFYEDAQGRRWLRTGDLGRLDPDGYLWITGRKKDLIIRGGHNIDPGLIEEALADHPDVAFVGAIGQPDVYSGELPSAYVELRPGAQVSADALRAYAAEHVAERAARPASVEILSELPKTAVGKVFKPTLRKLAIARVFKDTLAAAGIEAEVEVADDATLGMVAVVSPISGADEAAIEAALSGFARPWRLAGR